MFYRGDARVVHAWRPSARVSAEPEHKQMSDHFNCCLHSHACVRNEVVRVPMCGCMCVFMWAVERAEIAKRKYSGLWVSGSGAHSLSVGDEPFSFGGLGPSIKISAWGCVLVCECVCVCGCAAGRVESFWDPVLWSLDGIVYEHLVVLFVCRRWQVYYTIHSDPPPVVGCGFTARNSTTHMLCTMFQSRGFFH